MAWPWLEKLSTGEAREDTIQVQSLTAQKQTALSKIVIERTWNTHRVAAKGTTTRPSKRAAVNDENGTSPQAAPNDEKLAFDLPGGARLAVRSGLPDDLRASLTASDLGSDRVPSETGFEVTAP
jgi:hypothetical protein